MDKHLSPEPVQSLTFCKAKTTGSSAALRTSFVCVILIMPPSESRFQGLRVAGHIFKGSRWMYIKTLLNLMADDYVDDIVVSVWDVPHHCQHATKMEKNNSWLIGRQAAAAKQKRQSQRAMQHKKCSKRSSKSTSRECIDSWQQGAWARLWHSPCCQLESMHTCWVARAWGVVRDCCCCCFTKLLVYFKACISCSISCVRAQNNAVTWASLTHNGSNNSGIAIITVRATKAMTTTTMALAQSVLSAFSGAAHEPLLEILPSALCGWRILQRKLIESLLLLKIMVMRLFCLRRWYDTSKLSAIQLRCHLPAATTISQPTSWYLLVSIQIWILRIRRVFPFLLNPCQM